LTIIDNPSFSNIYGVKFNDISNFQINPDTINNSNVLIGHDFNDMDKYNEILSSDLEWILSSNGDATYPFKFEYNPRLDSNCVDVIRTRVQGISEQMTGVDLFTLEYPENNMSLTNVLTNDNINIKDVNGIIIRISLNENTINQTTIPQTTLCGETTIPYTEITNPSLGEVSLIGMKIKFVSGIYCIPELKVSFNTNETVKTIGFMFPDSCDIGNKFTIKGDIVVKELLNTENAFGPDIEIYGSNISC
jgi:hypothetical protein